ncbi:MAG: hypothetical protein H0U97_03915 [Gammaproteobacteria bacterium]|nr:hypothetical protein [Gammaproteobacteria bacterium]
MRIIAFVMEREFHSTYPRLPSAGPPGHRDHPAARGSPRWEEDFDPAAGTHLSEPPPEYELDQRVSR